MSAENSLSEYDAEQQRLMAEECIVVTPQDEAVGHASKKECHWIPTLKLHRAFSVFLFNSKGELLLQQRAGAKITFPLRWTNTCCSHPLYREGEREEKDQLGVKRAAQRKLEHELGIPVGAIGLDEFQFLTRIHYRADCEDGKWAEHEVDYILFAQKDIEFDFNKNEIEACKYVTKAQLQDMFEQQKRGEILISPWFHMICENFFFKWWDNLEEVMKGNGVTEEERAQVHKLKLDA